MYFQKAKKSEVKNMAIALHNQEKMFWCLSNVNNHVKIEETIKLCITIDLLGWEKSTYMYQAL